MQKQETPQMFVETQKSQKYYFKDEDGDEAVTNNIFETIAEHCENVIDMTFSCNAIKFIVKDGEFEIFFYNKKAPEAYISEVKKIMASFFKEAQKRADEAHAAFVKKAKEEKAEREAAKAIEAAEADRQAAAAKASREKEAAEMAAEMAAKAPKTQAEIAEAERQAAEEIFEDFFEAHNASEEKISQFIEFIIHFIENSPSESEMTDVEVMEKFAEHAQMSSEQIVYETIDGGYRNGEKAYVVNSAVKYIPETGEIFQSEEDFTVWGSHGGEYEDSTYFWDFGESCVSKIPAEKWVKVFEF